MLLRSSPRRMNIFGPHCHLGFKSHSAARSRLGMAGGTSPQPDFWSDPKTFQGADVVQHLQGTAPSLLTTLEQNGNTSGVRNEPPTFSKLDLPCTSRNPQQIEKGPA